MVGCPRYGHNLGSLMNVTRPASVKTGRSPIEGCWKTVHNVEIALAKPEIL